MALLLLLPKNQLAIIAPAVVEFTVGTTVRVSDNVVISVDRVRKFAVDHECDYSTFTYLD